MPDGELYLDPYVARAGARDLSAAGVSYLSEYWRIGIPLATDSGARPWGRDDIGNAFERNYRPIEQQMLLAWLRIGEYVQDLGEAAAATVTDNQGADQASAARVSRAYRDHP